MLACFLFINKGGNDMNKFLSSNATGYRLARTILQGIIGVVIANLDAIF